MESQTVEIIRTAAEIDGPWLSAALGRENLEVISTASIGTGQMSQSHRAKFAEPGGGEESVVVKLASEDSNSRGTGVGMRAYYREIAFYKNLAERLRPVVPECHLARYDEAEGWFTLVLEDIAGAAQGDQIAGCSPTEAKLAITALAEMHAPVLGDLHVGASDWLNLPSPLTQGLMTQLLPGFLERYDDRLDPAHVEVCERFVPVLDAWAADRRPPFGLIHGDYRLDNLLFQDATCTVVDWQTVSWGPALVDAAYFIGSALSDEDRRAHEEDLIRTYHDVLVSRGVESLSFDHAWEEYRRACFQGIVMTIAPAMVVERTDRGDDMFMAWIARCAQQILDLGSLELLPRPGAKP
jgi:hypothetical protein